MPSAPRLALALALLLACDAFPALAAAAPVVPDLGLATLNPFGYGQASSAWRPDEPHAFVLGGLAFTGTASMLNAFLVSGGTVSAGVELPTRWRWAFVPRVHGVFGSGSNSGTVAWLRGAADGRYTTRAGAMLSYLELGGGISLLDAPIPTTRAGVNRREQMTSGSPFYQVLFGLRSGAGGGPGGVLEACIAVGGGVEGVSGLELTVGIAF